MALRYKSIIRNFHKLYCGKCVSHPAVLSVEFGIGGKFFRIGDRKIRLGVQGPPRPPGC